LKEIRFSRLVALSVTSQGLGNESAEKLGCMINNLTANQ